jgi:hypothetical protein
LQERPKDLHTYPVEGQPQEEEEEEREIRRRLETSSKYLQATTVSTASEEEERSLINNFRVSTASFTLHVCVKGSFNPYIGVKGSLHVKDRRNPSHKYAYFPLRGIITTAHP